MIVMHALSSPELCLHLLDLVVAAVLDVYVHPVVAGRQRKVIVRI